MLLNRKGFTLVEAVATMVIVGLTVLCVTQSIAVLNKSKTDTGLYQLLSNRNISIINNLKNEVDLKLDIEPGETQLKDTENGVTSAKPQVNELSNITITKSELKDNVIYYLEILSQIEDSPSIQVKDAVTLYRGVLE